MDLTWTWTLEVMMTNHFITICAIKASQQVLICLKRDEWEKQGGEVTVIPLWEPPSSLQTLRATAIFEFSGYQGIWIFS